MENLRAKVMRFERERKMLETAVIDPQLKAKLLKEMNAELEKLTLDALQSDGSAAVSPQELAKGLAARPKAQ